MAVIASLAFLLLHLFAACLTAALRFPMSIDMLFLLGRYLALNLSTCFLTNTCSPVRSILITLKVSGKFVQAQFVQGEGVLRIQAGP